MSISIERIEARLEELKKEKIDCDDKLKSYQESIQKLINGIPEIAGHQQGINMMATKANSIQGKIDGLEELLGITKEESTVPTPIPVETDVVAKAIKDLEPEPVEESVEEEQKNL